MNATTRDSMVSSASGNWQTPENILDLVEDIFAPQGGIDLDPASPGADRTLVHANRYFTPADDGLAQPWIAKSVFLNPPYGRQIGHWTAKLKGEYLSHRTLAFLALLPARPDTRWWRGLILPSMCVCFLHQRVRYLNEAGMAQDSALFPSCLVWGGPDSARFRTLTAPVGSCYRLCAN